jgi:predicted transcriptional regulator
VKIAVSIPDDVFRRAERLAKQRKVSRSQLYTAALIQLLKDELIRAYDAAFADDRSDRFTDAAAFASVEWFDE